MAGVVAYAGEFGHTFVRTDGLPCHRGARGCLAFAPEDLDSRVAPQPLKGPAGQVRVNRAALGSNLMMIGAAELAFSGLLADPAGYFATHAS